MNRIPKSVAHGLYRFVKKCTVSYNPWDPTSRSAREFLRQIKAPKMLQANDRVAIDCDVHDTTKPPMITLSFINDTDLTIASRDVVAAELMSQMYQQAAMIENEFEDEGKAMP